MFKKHYVAIGLSISLILFLIATFEYPGGSLFNKNSVGFDWSKNFMSNLFRAKAINGLDNKSKYWADAGVIFLSASYALFFQNFSRKIPFSKASTIISYMGAGSMIFTFLLITPLHDIVVAIASMLFLTNFFYITFYVFKTKLTLLKMCCLLCLAFFTCFLAMYGFGNWSWLPFMQKITFSITLLLTLSIDYFVDARHFEHLKVQKPN